MICLIRYLFGILFSFAKTFWITTRGWYNIENLIFDYIAKNNITYAGIIAIEKKRENNTILNDDKTIDIIKMSIIKCSTVYKIKTDILIASVIEVLLIKHKLLMLSSQFIDFLEEYEKYITNQNKFHSLTSGFYSNLASLLQFIIFNEKASLITP